MILYWKKDSPNPYEHLKKSSIISAKTGAAIYPESVAFMRNFQERHIPLPPLVLEQWNKEADIFGSIYGASLKADIKWAKKCNDRNDEVLLFNEPQGNCNVI